MGSGPGWMYNCSGVFCENVLDGLFGELRLRAENAEYDFRNPYARHHQLKNQHSRVYQAIYGKQAAKQNHLSHESRRERIHRFEN